MTMFYATTIETPVGVLSGIIMVEDGGKVWAVPLDPANTDYQQYLAWLEAGNIPEPWEPSNAD